MLSAKQNRPIQQRIELVDGLPLKKPDGSGETD
jgi:hypothetical protein